MTITDFLLARIAEDEAWATACEGLHWHWVGNVTDHPVAPDPMLDECLYGADYENVSLRSVEEFPYESIPGTGPRFLVSSDEVRTVAAGHIIRHDPARVLAECAAKRQIVEYRIAEGFADDGMVTALRALAAVYADHPDYLEEWAL